MAKLLSERGGKTVTLLDDDTVRRTYPEGYIPEEGNWRGGTEEGIRLMLEFAGQAGCEPEVEIKVDTDTGVVTVDMPHYEDPVPGKATGILTAKAFSNLLFMPWANNNSEWTLSTASLNEEALKVRDEGLVLVDLDPYLNRKGRFTTKLPTAEHIAVIVAKLGHEDICPDYMDRMSLAGHILNSWLDSFPEEEYGEIPIEVLMAAQPELPGM